MLHVFEITCLTTLHFLFVKCLVPDLSVQMIDKRLIEQKRQDTLDMCRLFNAETEKLKTYREKPHRWDKPSPIEVNKIGRRVKRDVGVKPASTDVSNAKRVENIVDKFYEDLEENGQPVTYMKSNVTAATVADKPLINKTRRFHFAPAELLGPKLGSKDSSKRPDEDFPGGIEWHKRWKHGIVPYYIDSKTYDAELGDIIIKAFEYFEKATCIRLQRLKDRPTDSQSLQNVEWLYISNPSGIRQCVHSNERKENKGVQVVVFGYDCMSLGEIVHEVMHILGFSHEHTRPDRDQHITIMWNNIKIGYKKFFEIRTNDVLLNIPYDYASVLHYPPRAFSKNGQFTIVSKPGIKLGQRQGLSDGDVNKIGVIFGNECVERNRQYLLKTCPSVAQVDQRKSNITKEDVVAYYKDRLWPYGIVNYKLRDLMEFSTEEKENIKAVIRHIQKETCIQFKDLTRNSAEEMQSLEDMDNNDKGDQPHVSRENDHDADQPDNAENEIGGQLDKDDNVLRKGNSTTSGPTTAKNITMNTGKANKPRRAGKVQRRHAENIIVLARSPEPGCTCPPPGRPNGDKVLHINADCFNSVNDLLHLFVHLLGLDHQHNMHDRDSYLHILWDNLTPDIKEEMKGKLPPAASMGFDYDYQSVMHYPWMQIKNGVTNIMYPIWNDGWAMGHWQGLSSTDVFKLNLVYNSQCIERLKQFES